MENTKTNDLKKKVINYLEKDGFDKSKATELVCFSEIKLLSVIHIKYESGAKEYLLIKENEIEFLPISINL